MSLCVMCWGVVRFIYVFMCYVLGSGEAHLCLYVLCEEHINRQHIKHKRKISYIKKSVFTTKYHQYQYQIDSAYGHTISCEQLDEKKS